MRLWITYAEWLAQELDAGSVQAASEGSDATVPVATYASVVNVYERAVQLAGLHLVEVCGRARGCTGRGQVVTRGGVAVEVARARQGPALWTSYVQFEFGHAEDSLDRIQKLYRRQLAVPHLGTRSVRRPARRATARR